MNLCNDQRTKSFEIPTFSTFHNQINITVQTKPIEFYVLVFNGSVMATTSTKNPNVNINGTDFTIVTSCAMGTGNYLLQVVTSTYSVTCQYFNLTNCSSYFMSTHLAQSSCSESSIFTVTSFVMLMFYLIF
ncbi:glycoprotein E51 [Elephant endotheliotropic herpesvirus 1A]|nr:glycoprotein E51 [Elephant endotheliotropic herpesvirus 1A]